MTKDDDNHANQCNPNNDAYWQSRGEDERPEDWEERLEDEQQVNALETLRAFFSKQLDGWKSKV